MDQAPDITLLLEAWTGGDRAALDALMPSVIDELKHLARAFLARENRAHTLQATALVNEAYLRLLRVRPQAWESRHHFYALTAQIMRRILVDHARARMAGQRGGDAMHTPLEDHHHLASATSLLTVDEALLSLQKLDARKAEIAELRIFVGLGNSEVAEALGVSERTVIRDWLFAKAWLAREFNQSLEG